MDFKPGGEIQPGIWEIKEKPAERTGGKRSMHEAVEVRAKGEGNGMKREM